ncbi:MAG: hypothetical protein WD469_05575 [Paenibacillaceae bacterium]
MNSIDVLVLEKKSKKEEKMKLISVSVLTIVIILSGCGNSTQVDAVTPVIETIQPTSTNQVQQMEKNQEDNTFSELRSIAWGQVSDTAKKTVIGDWKEASIEKSSFEQVPIKVEKDSVKTSNNLYKVTFKTTQDEIIGSIGIYIDAVSNQVVGKDARK